MNMARTSVETQLSKIRKQVEALQAKEKSLLSKANAKVISEIAALVKQHNVTLEELKEALGKAKPARKPKGPRAVKKVVEVRSKVPPKYRNPADPNQTWTGRGRTPAWCQAMKDAGSFDTALITAE